MVRGVGLEPTEDLVHQDPNLDPYRTLTESDEPITMTPQTSRSTGPGNRWNGNTEEPTKLIH